MQPAERARIGNRKGEWRERGTRLSMEGCRGYRNRKRTVSLRQEGLIRNAMLILYLDKEGQPKFKRVFENQ